MNDLVTLAGSAIGVLAMVGAAMALGFRARARLTEVELSRIAVEEGRTLQDVLIAPDARCALARLADGAVLVARALGDGVSARIVSSSAARVTLKAGRLRVALSDIGYPPIELRLQQAPPAWAVAMAQGGPT
ncbi:MAG: hypothetical protein ABL883_06525 [Terricaulis sp.]